jgi:hypothetical protein
VLDERTVVIPDRLGNKMADSFQNILKNGQVALLCFVPGMIETLRINGTAYITDDPTLTSMLEQGHVVPQPCEHRDSLNPDDSSRTIYPCVSRSLSPTLTVDV